MSTFVISDTHLGDHLGRDLLRRDDVRRWLIATLADADQLVVLGDVLELRHAPVDSAVAAAEPFFAEVGEALEGRRIVLVPGNHDHQLVAPWIDRRRVEAPEDPLGLEQLMPAADCGPLGARLAELCEAELVVAYPGLWIRPDVWATHGHYLDCHLTVPRIECLAVAAVERVLGPLPAAPRRPVDYETILAPVYALSYALAQGARGPLGGDGPDISLRVWRVLQSKGALNSLRSALIAGVAAPTAIAALNRVLHRDFSADLSGAELLRAGLRAMKEVVSGLGIDAAHVLFGHTHRAGPFDSADADLWTIPSGTRLLNTGSWLYEAGLHGEAADRSPYFPGTHAVVPSQGAPELRRRLRLRGS